MRFHDLRHTCATMALEHGMDVKTLTNIIGHVSSETTLDIYPQVTDLMQQQAAMKTDRQIRKTDVPHTHGSRKPAFSPAPSSRPNPNTENPAPAVSTSKTTTSGRENTLLEMPTENGSLAMSTPKLVKNARKNLSP